MRILIAILLFMLPVQMRKQQVVPGEPVVKFYLTVDTTVLTKRYFSRYSSWAMYDYNKPDSLFTFTLRDSRGRILFRYQYRKR